MMHDKPYKFVDLFAGYGGFHLAFKRVAPDAKCVLMSEKDKYARMTYEANHDMQGVQVNTDITELEALPNHDILFAGFPCQPFSMVGKRLGERDKRSLFGEIIRLLQQKTYDDLPAVLVLENVQGILSIDNGATIRNIQRAIIDLGYHYQHDVLNSWYFGTPQQRKRVFIVAWKPELAPFFYFPHGESFRGTLGDFMDAPQDIPDKLRYDEAYVNHKQNGVFSVDVYDSESECCYVLTAKGLSSRRKFFYDEIGYRLQSISESKRLQGLPHNFVFPVSEAQAYKQIGNSVHIGTVEALLRAIHTQLLSKL